MIPDHPEQARRRLASLALTPAERRWQLPFPLGVFGTLRAGFGNHHLLQPDRAAGRRRAFLPHFRARELGLHFHPGASAPFEIYFYQPADWRAVIGPVDQLEDFAPPGSETAEFHRTLAWLALLPDGFEHPAFTVPLEEERDLHIAPSAWAEHERVPCWIYSNIRANRRAAALADAPIIWDNVVRR
jgi:gamma-glutamylcyclotransferase (GGCT)/AIG2-like uncharacterized protein YtfP